MHAVHLPVLAGAWLLVGSGLTKTFRPVPTERAIRALFATLHRDPARVRRSLVHSLGLGELAIGTLVLSTDWTAPTWMIAASYSAFSLFVIAALATGAPMQSCGCFGAADAPPSLVHLGIDAAIAAFAVLAATDAGTPRDALTAWHGGGALVSLALAGACLVAFRRPSPRRRATA